MSLPLTDANGVVQTIANGTPVVWNAGLGYDANGLLCVTSTLSDTDVWINGWRRDALGRLVVLQSFPEGQPFIYNAGWPTDKVTGAIITQQNIPAPTDPRIAGVAVGPLGGVYMTEGGYIWSPLSLWPDGIASPGMWISPRTLDSQWQDYTGTTPVAVPGSVADSANPVGLALDIRAGAPDSLGPELSPSVNWSGGYTTDAGRQVPIGWHIYTQANVSAMAVSPNSLTFSTTASLGGVALTEYPANSNKFTAYSIKARKTATGTGGLYLYADTWRLIVPADAAVGDWYSASFETVAGIPPVISCLTAGGSWEVEYLSFKEIPGNHMLQATSAARPLESARVNYLWQNLAGTTHAAGKYIRQSGVTVDDLGSGIYRINFAADGQGLFGSITLNNASLGSVVGTDYIGSIELSVESGTGTVTLREPIGSQFPDTDVALTTTWTRFDTPAAAATSTDFGIWIAKKAGSVSSCLARFPQLQIGSVATDYQRVTSASNYDATGFPTYQKYDGVDDGMATAAFSAGTLIAGMDCMIAVRRDSAAATYLISDTGSRGFFEWESGNSSRPDVSAGTPTYYVDGVAVTATRGALFTALTAGEWHILEARGLDLSTWTKVEVSSLVSYRLNGPRGDIMLYPSATPTEDKDAARQYLADYYGVTLP